MQVWLRGRVTASRKQGKNLCFITLRQGMHSVQAVVFAEEGELVAFAAALPRESIVDVYASVSVAADPVKSCSQQGVELQVCAAIMRASRGHLAATRGSSRGASRGVSTCADRCPCASHDPHSPSLPAFFASLKSGFSEKRPRSAGDGVPG